MAKIYVTHANFVSLQAAKKSTVENSDLVSARILEILIEKIKKEIKKSDGKAGSVDIEITRSEANTLVLGEKYLAKSKRAHSFHSLALLIEQAERVLKGESEKEKAYPFRIDILEKEHQSLIFAAALLKKSGAKNELRDIEDLIKKIEIKKLNAKEQSRIFGDEKPSIKKMPFPLDKIKPEKNLHFLPNAINQENTQVSSTKDEFQRGDRVVIIEVPAKKTDYEIGDEGIVLNTSGKSTILVRWDKDKSVRTIKRKRIVKKED